MGNWKRWTEEERQFLRDNAVGRSYKETLSMMNKKFGNDRSMGSMVSMMVQLGIRNGLEGCDPDKEPWTAEEEQFLRDNVKGISFKELSEKHNKVFKQQRSEYACQNKATKLGLVNGRDTKVQKGSVALRALPIGSVIKGKHGDLYVKISNDYIGSEKRNDSLKNYKRLAVVNWEKEHPPLDKSKGESLLFLDGNRENCDISNLRMVTKRIRGGLQYDEFLDLSHPDLMNAAVDYEFLKYELKDAGAWMKGGKE